MSGYPPYNGNPQTAHHQHHHPHPSPSSLLSSSSSPSLASSTWPSGVSAGGSGGFIAGSGAVAPGSVVATAPTLGPSGTVVSFSSSSSSSSASSSASLSSAPPVLSALNEQAVLEYLRARGLADTEALFKRELRRGPLDSSTTEGTTG